MPMADTLAAQTVPNGGCKTENITIIPAVKAVAAVEAVTTVVTAAAVAMPVNPQTVNQHQRK